jgi:transposase-like protein
MLSAGLTGMRRHSPTPRRRCPFTECPSHARVRSKGIVRHGYMRSRHGARLRLLCRACGRTFCGRRGAAYYRLQHSCSTFDPFAARQGEGLSCASLARSLRVCPATITRWLARAAKHARAFSEEHDRIAQHPSWSAIRARSNRALSRCRLRRDEVDRLHERRRMTGRVARPRPSVLPRRPGNRARYPTRRRRGTMSAIG